MKVLWITNIIFPELASMMRGDEYSLKSSGGWLVAAADALSLQDEKIELYVATVCGDINDISYYSGARYKYILLPSHSGLYRYDKELEYYWVKVNNEIKPDVIHIHGTEYLHGLAYVNACGNKGVVLSIQGLISQISKHYLDGVSAFDILSNTSIKEIVTRQTVIDKCNGMRRRSKCELQLIDKINHIIGRTDWDKAHIKALNPSANYFTCFESMRESFYSGQWVYKSCQKHTIFIGQASYPIKGFHFLIRSLPYIMRDFPDVKVMVAGPKLDISIAKTKRVRGTFYENFLAQEAKKCGVVEKINFLGPLSESEMKHQLLSCNLYVISSTIENSPNSLAEAQLLGVPCLAAYTGGIPSMVDNNQNSVLYQYDDAELLATKIINCFNQKGGVNCSKQREISIHRHDKNLNASKTLEIYNKICQKGK